MSLDPAQELARFERELEETEKRVVWLKAVVGTMRSAGIVPRTKLSPPRVATGRLRERVSPIMAVTPPKGKPRMGLKNILIDVMSDGEIHETGEIMAMVKEKGVYDEEHFPKRVSFTNRLNDLVNEGRLLNPKRGVYQLVPAGDSGESQEGAAASQTDPAQASQLDDW